MILFGIIAGGLIFMINKVISAIDNTIENKLKFLDSHNSFSRNRDWPLNRHVNFQIFRQLFGSPYISLVTTIYSS